MNTMILWCNHVSDCEIMHQKCLTEFCPPAERTFTISPTPSAFRNRLLSLSGMWEENFTSRMSDRPPPPYNPFRQLLLQGKMSPVQFELYRLGNQGGTLRVLPPQPEPRSEACCHSCWSFWSRWAQRQSGGSSTFSTDQLQTRLSSVWIQPDLLQ